MFCAQLPEPPSVWSQPRPWDPQKSAQTEELDKDVQQGPPEGLPRTLQEAGGAAASEAAREAAAREAGLAVGPTQGCLALTSGQVFFLWTRASKAQAMQSFMLYAVGLADGYLIDL